MSADVYQIVTDRIIKMMEEGNIPWRKCWNASGGMPKNLISKKHYHGINSLILGCAPYSSPYWLTFKQAIDKGGNVRKGEKSEIAVFWKMFDTTDEETGTARKIPMLRYYNVFNLEQCDGIEHPAEDAPADNGFTAIERAEQIISSFSDRPEIEYVGNRACYAPISDTIKMPKKETFDTPEDFYNILFHEMSHSTGHAKRLARKEVIERHHFGSEDYSLEELVAEFSAAFLSNHAGIETTTQSSAAYIQGWLKALKNDKKLLVTASSRATKAANYILGIPAETY